MVVDAGGRLIGLVTDGDVRRLVNARGADALGAPLSDCMTKHPRTLPADALVRDAVRMVRELRVDELPVVDAEGKPLGLLDVQDLVAMKVVRCCGANQCWKLAAKLYDLTVWMPAE